MGQSPLFTEALLCPCQCALLILTLQKLIEGSGSDVGRAKGRKIVQMIIMNHFTKKVGHFKIDHGGGFI